MYYLEVSQMVKKLTRRERDFQRHRSEIIEAAEKLFEEIGYYETTMELVAEHAEFSKGSLYNYFDNKEVLFYEILNRKTEILKIGITKVVGEAVGIVDKLNALIEFYLNFSLENIGFFKIAQAEKFNLSSFTQKKLMTSLRENYYNHIEGISSIVKLNKQKSEEESNLIALAINGMLNGLITRNLLYKDKVEIERIKVFAKSKVLKLIE